jgi:hypothetical protein
MPQGRSVSPDILLPNLLRVIFLICFHFKNFLFFYFVGAVANGRAKFEAQKVSPEKPIRFFGSRSRTNSPMLPVRTPKVPTLPGPGQNGSGQNGNEGKGVSGLSNSNNNKKDSAKSPSTTSAVSDQSKTPSLVSKFLPKMKK